LVFVSWLVLDVLGIVVMVECRGEGVWITPKTRSNIMEMDGKGVIKVHNFPNIYIWLWHCSCKIWLLLWKDISTDICCPLSLEKFK